MERTRTSQLISVAVLALAFAGLSATIIAVTL